jgi:hypothetical protein
MPPASSFRLLVSQSGTGAFWYRTGPLIPVPDSPAFQYFKKEIHTVCMYTPQEKDWDTACTFTLLVVHTAGRGKTPCKSILLAVEGYTPCMSLLLVVKRGGDTSSFCWLWKGAHPGRPYCWLCNRKHPARPYCWCWKGGTVCTSFPATFMYRSLFLRL